MAIAGLDTSNSRAFPVENITALRATIPKADGQLYEMDGSAINNGLARNRKAGLFRYFANVSDVDYPDDGGYFIKPASGGGMFIRHHETNEFILDWYVNDPSTDLNFALGRMQALLAKLNLEGPVVIKTTSPVYRSSTLITLDFTYADYDFTGSKFIWTTKLPVSVKMITSSSGGPKRAIQTPFSFVKGGMFIGPGGVAKGTNVCFDCTFTNAAYGGVNFSDVHVTGFDISHQYGSNAYMFSWRNCRFAGGVAISSKTGATNYGENMGYYHCVFGDGFRFMDLNAPGGFYFNQCSFDYTGENDPAIPLFKLQGQINFTDCHFEWGNDSRPNAGNSVMRVLGDASTVVIRGGTIILNSNAETNHDYWFNMENAGVACSIQDTYVYGPNFTKAWSNRPFELKMKTNGNGRGGGIPANTTLKRTEATILMDPSLNDVTVPDFFSLGDFTGADPTRTRLKTPNQEIVVNGDGTITFKVVAKSNDQPGILFPVAGQQCPVVNFEYKVKHTPANFNAFAAWRWVRVEGDTRGYRVIKALTATSLGGQTLTNNLPDWTLAISTAFRTFHWESKPEWATHLECKFNIANFVPAAAGDNIPNGLTIRNLYYNYFNSPW